MPSNIAIVDMMQNVESISSRPASLLRMSLATVLSRRSWSLK